MSVPDRHEFGLDTPSRAAMVVSFFAKGKADAKEVAQRAGFPDHRKMAEYMKEKGYAWSPVAGNYVFQREQSEAPTALATNVPEEASQAGDVPSEVRDELGDLAHFAPVLEMLYRNKERLTELLQAAPLGTLPRYTVPGVPRTKSIYMSDGLARLLTEFSVRKGIPQREIVEAALVEFLRHYGFGPEVQALIDNS